MKALVTQLWAMGLPPSSALIAGKATAGPVKVSGIAAAAEQTAIKTKIFSAILVGLDLWGTVIGYPLVRGWDALGRCAAALKRLDFDCGKQHKLRIILR
ncbi:hypothetical protein GCM10010520_44440 [Rhizobium viscosum]